MYDVDAKKEKRRDDRTVKIAGEVYPRRSWTVGLDRELDEFRQRLSDFGEEYGKLANKVAQLDDRGRDLPASKRHSEKVLKDAEARIREIDDLVMRERMGMIATILGPSENDSKLDVEALEAHLELEDVAPILKMLSDGEKTVGGDDPTGESESD